MNNLAIHEWLKLTTRTKQNIFSEVSKEIGLPDAAVEKDWWIITLTDKNLYDANLYHRKTITALRGINHENHVPVLINPIPPNSLSEEWKKDYEIMPSKHDLRKIIIF